MLFFEHGIIESLRSNLVFNYQHIDSYGGSQYSKHDSRSGIAPIDPLVTRTVADFKPVFVVFFSQVCDNFLFSSMVIGMSAWSEIFYEVI